MPIRKGEALSGLTLRLSVIGIPTYTINPFAGLMVKWATCSGPEWTVKRLKDLKISLLQLHAGLPITAPIARNRYGEIKGVVGSLMRWSLKSEKNFVRVLSAFMAYSHWYSSKLTRTQRKKFLQAVTADPVKIPEVLRESLIRTTRSVVGRREVMDKPSPLLTWLGSPAKRAPTWFGSVKQSDRILAELMLIRNDGTWEHIQRHYDSIYRFVFEALNVHEFCDSLHEDQLDHSSLIAGEVHFIQEPGYKLRSIASPYRLFQVASEPLKNDLKVAVSKVPWDCTHDQYRAIPAIQRALSEGKTVYSVDLSNATDYFPWELQEIVLQTIYGEGNPYVSLFREISQSRWRSEIGWIRWNRGQPLGFNPSFFTFTLTHGLLLETLRRVYSLPGSQWDSEFFVLGDDVVIIGEFLYDRYISLLNQLGCPYSKEKSIASSKLSEFAGKIVTQKSVIPQLKWRDVSDDNFIDLARLLGPRIKCILTPKQREIVDMFAHVPDFVHPYGLNWSFPGSNLDKMVQLGVGLVAREEILYSLTGIRRLTMSQFYAGYGAYTADLKSVVQYDKVSDLIKTFDEKVMSVFVKLATWFDRQLPVHGFRDIPWTLRHHLQDDQLPLEQRPASRISLLKRLLRYKKRYHSRAN